MQKRAKQSTNTRIDNLLNLTGLSQRRINSQSELNSILDMPCNYKGVDERLDALRQSSMEYLYTALKGIKS